MGELCGPGLLHSIFTMEREKAGGQENGSQHGAVGYILGGISAAFGTKLTNLQDDVLCQPGGPGIGSGR